jgi:trans-aconitate methyltransferase
VTTNPRDHWQAVWRDRSPETLSWHQDHAEPSLALITERVAADAAIIDVGGGDSPLAGDLVRSGYRDVSVLDISDAALVHGQRRLGPLAEQVRWITADITTYRPTRRYQLWHDRAAFHFLTTPTDQHCYAHIAAAAVAPGGWLIVAGFAPDGPEQCSGLPVQRHSRESLTEALAPAFTPVDFTSERHTTPSGVAQSFLYATFRRR